LVFFWFSLLVFSQFYNCKKNREKYRKRKEKYRKTTGKVQEKYRKSTGKVPEKYRKIEENHRKGRKTTEKERGSDDKTVGLPATQMQTEGFFVMERINEGSLGRSLGAGGPR